MSECSGLGCVSQYANALWNTFIDTASESRENSAVGCSSETLSGIINGGSPVETDLSRAQWRAAEVAEIEEEIAARETFFEEIIPGLQRGLRHESNRHRIRLAQDYIILGHLTGNREYFENAENHLLAAIENEDLSRPGYVRDLPDAAIELANLYLIMSDLNQAERYVELALNNREGSEMTRHRALFITAQITQRRGNPAAARIHFEEIRTWSRNQTNRNALVHYWNMESKLGLKLLHAQSALALAHIIIAEARAIQIPETNGEAEQTARATKLGEAFELLCEVLFIDEARVEDEEEGFILIGYEALILAMEICIEQASTQTEAVQALRRLPWTSIYNSLDMMLSLNIEEPGENDEDLQFAEVFQGLWNIPSLPQHLLSRLTVIKAVYENHLTGGQTLLEENTADPSVNAAPTEGASCPIVMPREGQTLHGAFFANEITEEAINRYEQMAGIQDEGLDVGLIFKGFIDGLTFPSDQARVMEEHGGVLFIKIEPWAWRGVEDQTFPLGEIANGDFDHILLHFAAGAAMYGGPVMVSFGHEMNGTWYPWHTSLADAELYRRAFRHVVETVSSVACNITWVWNPTIDFAMRDYFPGPSYVDWIAIDGYDLELAGRARRNFANLFEAAIRDTQRLDPEAPIMIGEFGSAVFNEDVRPQQEFLRDSFRYMAESHQPGNIPISAFVYFNHFAERETGTMSWVVEGNARATYAEEIDRHGAVYTQNYLTTLRPPTDFSLINLAAEEAHLTRTGGEAEGALLIATIRELYRAFGRAELEEEAGNYSCRVALSAAEGEDAAGFQIDLLESTEAREMRSLKFSINVANMSENGRVVLRLYTADNDDDTNPSLRAEYTTATLPEDGEAAIDLTNMTDVVRRIHFVYYSEEGGQASFAVNNLRLERTRVVSSSDGPAITLSGIDTEQIAAAQRTARADLEGHLAEITASGNTEQVAEAQLEFWTFAHFTPAPSDINVVETIGRLPANLQRLWQVQIAMTLVNELDSEASRELLAGILGDRTWIAQANPEERQLAALTIIHDRLLQNEPRLALFRGQNLFARAQLTQALGREGAAELIVAAREATAPLLATRPESSVHFRIWDQQDKRSEHLAKARSLMADILMAENNSTRNLIAAQNFLVEARETFGQEIEGFAVQLRLAENLFRQGEINGDSSERVRLMTEARDLLNDIIRRESSARQSSTWLTSIAADAQGLLPRVYLGLIESTSWQGGEQNLERANTLLRTIPANVLTAVRRDEALHPKYLLIRAEIQMRREETNTLMLESALQAAALASNNEDLIIRYVRGMIEAAFHIDDRAEAITHLQGIFPAIDASVAGDTQNLAQALIEVALGNFERYRNDFAAARTHYTGALALYPNAIDAIREQRADVRDILLQANLGLGEIHRYAEGFRHFSTSRRHYQAAEIVAREGSSTSLTRSQIAFALGELNRLENHFETALEQYNTVISIYEHRPDQETPLGTEVNAMLAQTHIGLLAIYQNAEGRQNPNEAASHRQAATELIRSLPTGARRSQLEQQLAGLAN